MFLTRRSDRRIAALEATVAQQAKELADSTAPLATPNVVQPNTKKEALLAALAAAGKEEVAATAAAAAAAVQASASYTATTSSGSGGGGGIVAQAVSAPTILFARSNSGAETLRLECYPHTTILQLKEQIVDKHRRLLAQNTKLLFAGRKLLDDEPTHGFATETTLHYILPTASVPVVVVPPSGDEEQLQPL